MSTYGLCFSRFVSKLSVNSQGSDDFYHNKIIIGVILKSLPVLSMAVDRDLRVTTEPDNSDTSKIDIN